jgi:hypothetical protein
MKMDATQKRRMWQMAIVYFCLSILVWVGYGIDASSFWLGLLNFLQPLFCLTDWLIGQAMKLEIIKIGSDTSLFLAICIISSLVVSMLIWSSCFGWIYARLVNWFKQRTAK